MHFAGFSLIHAGTANGTDPLTTSSVGLQRLGRGHVYFKLPRLGPEPAVLFGLAY